MVSYGYKKPSSQDIAKGVQRVASSVFKLKDANEKINKGLEKYKIGKPTTRVAKKGYNKYAGAVAGSVLGYLTTSDPYGAIVGGYRGYHAGKRLD